MGLSPSKLIKNFTLSNAKKPEKLQSKSKINYRVAVEMLESKY